jgi:uroporphyrin-III C-methyltransferase / precorrin-2 dehydrogenase / sirohydrochlorin ferrochelatase
MSYPLHLSIAGKRVLVVGAGAVAVRRIDGLLRAGADVVVVAPHADPAVLDWAARGALAWRPRAFDYSDVIGAWLVHAATDDPSVNARVAAEASRRRIWAVRADEATAGTALTPAVLDLSGAVVSVTTGDPRRSIALRDDIRAGLVTGDLAARPRRHRPSGSVVLIGGGPGDPDLITVRGRRELLQADVIVYDRLAPLALLEEVDADVELIDAGKRPGHHALTQDEINAVIVDRARRGLRVARLKGGDPFVLGRGSEEVLACSAAGVDVEVVPGLSSAVAAPAAAGIPVTHRGVSTGFVVLSGHVVGDIEAIARSGLTVVVLMGVSTLPDLVAAFLAAGRAASTPVAVVHRAYDPRQTVVVGTLVDIEERRASADVANPSVIVIGDVVSVAPALALELAS